MFQNFSPGTKAGFCPQQPVPTPLDCTPCFMPASMGQYRTLRHLPPSIWLVKTLVVPKPPLAFPGDCALGHRKWLQADGQVHSGSSQGRDPGPKRTSSLIFTRPTRNPRKTHPRSCGLAAVCLVGHVRRYLFSGVNAPADALKPQPFLSGCG